MKTEKGRKKDETLRRRKKREGIRVDHQFQTPAPKSRASTWPQRAASVLTELMVMVSMTDCNFRLKIRSFLSFQRHQSDRRNIEATPLALSLFKPLALSLFKDCFANTILADNHCLTEH